MRPFGLGSKVDRGIALVVLVTALGLRWPLRGTALEEFDSANFAMGIERLDLERHHPHPPGYILFIWAARLALLFTNDPVRAMTSVGALSGAASVALLYLLLRHSLRRHVALTGSVLYGFSAQVWLQHVRPLSDAFAGLWLLLAATALVYAIDGSGKALVAGAFLSGLACGSKQVFAVFLGGAILAAVCSHLRRRRLATVALSAAVGLGVAVWLVPLALHCGSLGRYLQLSAAQASFQQAEGLVFDWHADRFIAFVDVLRALWMHSALFIPMWVLVLVGAGCALATRGGPRWLLWLALPGFLCHAALLGPTPRYAVHYMPFLCGLAAYGFAALVRAIASRVSGLVSPFRLIVVAHTVLALVWASIQTERALPTLLALARGELPVVRALEHIQSHFDPGTTVTLVWDVTLTRQLDYYAPRHGLHVVPIDAVTRDDISGRRHILLVQSSIRPRVPRAFQVEARLLRQWEARPPRWLLYSTQLRFWRVVLFELIGPYVSLRGFTREDPADGLSALRAGRRAQIRVYNAPRGGFRLRAGSAVTAECPGTPAAVSINRRRVVAWNGKGALEVEVGPTEVREPYVRLDLRAVSALGIADSCLRLAHPNVEALQP